MLSNDLKKELRTREQIRESMHQALKDNDAEGYAKAFDEMMERVGADIREEYDSKLQELQQTMDNKVLQARGANLLTSEERKFYEKFGDCIRAKDPKQALTNANLIMPDTVIDRVFEELQSAHPLLSRINFMPSGAAAKIITNTTGYQRAVWGELCDDIVKEILAGFAVVNTTLFKLSAFLPVCKAMLDLGPEWLDNFIRQTLYEAYANGAEAGFYDGTGKDQPIGMTRQVGTGVTVTDGVYPRKAKIKLNDLSTETLGGLLGLLAVDANGKPRQVRDLIMVVNPHDYFTKIMPATTVMAPDGTFRNNVLPYPIEIIQSAAANPGEAALGIGYRYLGLIGSDSEGRIDYSDHYQFLQDNRVYLIKGYANGMPLDNNAFMFLDVSALKPIAYKVEMIESREPSTDATLGSLRIGSKAMTPAFAPATDTYTAATTDATNTITAVPATAGATVEITAGTETVSNGSAATWSAGENTVTVKVTAEDGTTTKTYTVTVTKS